MMQSTLLVPNAILFVVDPKNRNAQVPTYESGQIYAASESCISIATCADVDGPVTVTLEQATDDITGEDEKDTFIGTIHTPRQCVAIVTSQLDIVLACNVASSSVRVEIVVNRRQSPNVIHVKVLSDSQ